MGAPIDTNGVPHANGNGLPYLNGNGVHHTNGNGYHHSNGNGTSHTNGNGVYTNGNGISHVNGNGTHHVNGNGHGNGVLSHHEKMQRRQSSPLAPPFMVSAPGKVIVFGEHSVVHGKVCYTTRPYF